ncbi:MAG: 4-hydroxy-tetrahydrodipicolinate synthase [Clostridia bacterium]|nr:4-hydroxy-tetrahydrodipicolinate synthase [Clostridia bacterium]
MIGFFNGTATAMITPFNENGINFASFAKMMDYQIENGTDVLVILGTTGEPATMTEEEKVELMRFAIAYNKGRVKIVFGTGSNCTEKAIKASVQAEKLGADGLLVVTPYYNKCTQNGIYEYYKAVCAAVSIPVIAYNVPARTGVNILPATAERLTTLSNMAGIKEACGNMEQICETMRRIRGKMDLYSGDDNLNLPMLAIGAAGLISVASNIAPKEVKEVFNLMKDCNLAAANELEDKLLPLIDACFTEVNPIPAKAGCNMIGLNAGIPRAPLTELEDKHKVIMQNCINNLGLKSV